MFNWLHARSSITGPNKVQHTKLPPGDDSSSIEVTIFLIFGKAIATLPQETNDKTDVKAL